MEARVVRSVIVGDTALLYSDFHGTSMAPTGETVPVESRAIEVLRRRANGTWVLVVGDPNGRAR